jgi:hypothetical protein
MRRTLDLGAAALAAGGKETAGVGVADDVGCFSMVAVVMIVRMKRL